MTKRTALYLLAAGLIAFALAFLTSYTGTIAVPRVSINWKAASNEDAYRPDYDTETGREWAFVYVGSSGCAASNRDFLPGAVRKLKRSVQEQARVSGHAFAAVGVAKDWGVDAGIEHLDKFGPFDEITAGRNWLNLGVLRYVWDEIPGTAATPQVLVVSRRVETSGEPSTVGTASK